ncbi:MAG: SMC family ATPase [Lachnospiraceae bacterium]|nr:SMC family ATPase [Lachnospiraceae bacterium]
MKPIILEMTAFGSYAGKTVVDFKKLQHDLYLITGDTGAGKTTIFDGIMFALFGESSGEENAKAKIRARSFEMMHCDYVDKSEDTIVKLTFEQSGREHVVERKFHYQKNQKTGEYEKGIASAIFWEYGKDPVKKDVTKRIEELLGMNSEQFRKIVMLAQGEFKKFLEADSGKKEEILATLFDNSDYVYYQSLLSSAKKKLSEQRNRNGYDKINSAMEYFERPAGISEEEAEGYTPGHSQLENQLFHLVKKEEEHEKKLSAHILELKEKKEKVVHNKAIADEQNKKFAELKEKMRHREELSQRREDMEQERKETLQVENVFYKVKPKEEIYHNAKRKSDIIKEEIESLKEQFEKRQTDKSAKKDDLEKKEKNQTVIDGIVGEIKILEDSLNKYQDYDNEVHSLETKENEKKKAKIKWEQYKSCLEEMNTRIQEYKSQENELAGSGAEVEKLKNEFEKIQKEVKILLGDETNRNQSGSKNIGIRGNLKEIQKKEEKIQKDQRILLGLVQKTSEEKVNYDRIYNSFLSGQAGFLAEQLELEIKKKGEAYCPVCHSKFHLGDLCEFAVAKEEIPSKEEVNEAEMRFRLAEENRSTLERKIEKTEVEIEKEKENVLASFRQLKPELLDFETLCETGYLEKVIEEYKDKKRSKEEEFNQAIQNHKTYQDLHENLIPKEEKKKEECQKKIDQCNDDIHQLETECSGLRSKIEEWKKELKYESLQNAEIELKKKKDNKEKLQKEVDTARKAYEKSVELLNQISGELDSKKKELPVVQNELEEAKGKLEQVLQEYRFDSIEEAALIFAKVGNVDTEKWIDNKKKRMNDYENDIKNTNSRIETLQSETMNLSEIDTRELQKEHDFLTSQIKQEEAELKTYNILYSNHKTTYEIVKEAKSELARTESAWQRISRLADLATGGQNAEGGKLSFERYMMGYVFREVLEMANHHLDVMSGGRYELQHEMSARRQYQAAGLEISILDQTTGKTRDSASLSGGESFLTSLALALGLSDVVQNHAGGYQLDALFIDEGFGSLDGDVLEKALTVLNSLTEGHRMVGIISHVDKLEESISQKMIVRHTDRGSVLHIVN